MSRLEKVNLFFGFVALLADLASLLVFVTGLISFEQLIPQNVNLDSALFLYKVVSFLFLMYGWFIFSWYLTRRSLVLKKSKRTSLSERAGRAVAGVGFFLIPIAISWLLFVSQPNNVMILDNGNGVKVAVTLTPTATPVPTNTPTPKPTLISGTPEPEPTQRAPSSISDSGAFFALFFGLLFGMPFMGFAIWVSIVLLMPLINVELLDD